MAKAKETKGKEQKAAGQPNEDRPDRQIILNAKAAAKKRAAELKQDTFVYIWSLFVIAFVVMTIYFKSYVKEMINISVLFMIFFYLEPLMFGVTGTTVTTLLSRGRKVANWKRFPLFFLIIIMVYVMYTGVQAILDMAFPEEHVNIIFVLMWLGMLFLLWIYKFSMESEL
jgi:hypothetical protein